MDLIAIDELQTTIGPDETPEQATERVKRAHKALALCHDCGRDAKDSPNMIYVKATKKFAKICGPCARKR